MCVLHYTYRNIFMIEMKEHCLLKITEQITKEDTRSKNIHGFMWLTVNVSYDIANH